MAKFIMALFLTAGLAGVSYFTYVGTGQEKIETLTEDKTARSNSYHGGGGSYSGGSYNSSGYSYGK
jgi:hypothetical protein